MGAGRAPLRLHRAAPEDAGHSVLLVFVEDVDARVAQITAQGLSPTQEETYANGVRKITYRDPDGNEFAFGGGRQS